METSILFELQDDVNLVAMAIKSVLNLDVTIYDDRKIVVAATGGGNHAQVGQEVRGFIVSQVIKAGKAVYNFQPGSHEICKPCYLWGNCPEKMDISYPLKHEGKTIGVISLTAFSEEQKRNFKLKHEELSNYLEKMADLISNKINVGTLFKKYHSMSQMLQVTIQSMYEGVLAVDSDGKIIELNRSGEQILGIKKEDIVGQSIENIWPKFPSKEVLHLGKSLKSEEYSCAIGEKKVKIVANITPLLHEGVSMGAVTSFKDLNEVQQFIYNMTSENDSSTFDSIIGKSHALVAAKNQARRIAAVDSTVLILGESGTGKELFTRSIHAQSKRKNKPFRAINCAAIPDHLLESELFGYTEGAFTGANRKGKMGKFEMANGGTIFLDEIGDMPLHLQVKILRVLEERTVERIGGNEPIPIDVRIIAATNKNLEQMISNGEFREDLFYRLNVIPIELPSLRERIEDVPILIQHFIKYYNNITGKQIRGLTQEAEHILKGYHWPGNVRELQNVIEYAVHMATSHWIEEKDLPKRLLAADTSESLSKEDDIIPLKDMEQMMMQRALDRFGTSVEGKRRAAELLGINLATLYRKIARLEKEKAL